MLLGLMSAATTGSFACWGAGVPDRSVAERAARRAPGASAPAARDVSRAGAEISGLVRMPEVCTPSVSPAVVYLSPAGPRKSAVRTETGAPGGSARSAEVALVNQRGLQFTPRVQAIALGQTVRFTNDDGETHNVHVVSPGFGFNDAMGPGQFRDFTPDRPGVMTLACDIHIHMRGFVVVSPTPWVQVCSPAGRFRLEGVPDGRYVLTVWHEMGDPLRTNVDVAGSEALELAPLVLTARADTQQVAAGSNRALAPVRPWSDVLDRISVMIAASRDAATRSGDLAKARRMAEDAYWGEFEASDMETAVRRHLGFTRAGDLEQGFRRIRSIVRDVAEKRRPAADLDDPVKTLMLNLVSAARELNTRGVTDGSHIDAAGDVAADQAPALAAGPAGDPKMLLAALRRGFDRVGRAADLNRPDDAASELATVYWTEFEPLERYLEGHQPRSVKPLEIQFSALRGDLSAGLNGEKLADRLDALALEVEHMINQFEARPAGTFGAAFIESLITIAREGVEVILVLAMLFALVAKASPAAATRAPAVRAIWWGVALAAVASLATAASLNLLVYSMQGRAREILEGLVMLLAAGVLFYVSYWLVSQAEAKRWMDYLKQQARRGLEWGGQGTLAVTAFLAVYREGAETALMYQALLGSQGQTRPGLVGVALGFLVGMVVLAIIAGLIRATSVRLPLHTFFKFTGLFLFALAVVFAGNGVFELQNAGILITTRVPWLRGGLPLLGLYPNVQVMMVQGILLVGALVAWVMIPRWALVDSSNGPPADDRRDASPPTTTGAGKSARIPVRAV
jgi:high-affinity iron transporter